MSIQFTELAGEWLSQVAAIELKPSGYRSYEAICRNHLVPAFGQIPLEDVTPSLVQAYVADKVAGGLSPRTVTNHVQVLRRLMRYAVECGYVAADPTTSVMTPRVEAPSTRLRYLTPEQVRTLIEKTPASGRVLVVTAALTGLRKGELLALTFGDIDVEQRTIRVSKTMRNGIVTSPKTPWSTGSVPIPRSLVPLLQERRKKAPDPEGLVFCRRDGSPLPDHLPNRILTKALAAAGLPEVTWHEATRHSWVVAHLAAGTDIPTLQRLGRWKSADVLLSTYAHMLPAAGGDAARRVDLLVSGGK